MQFYFFKEFLCNYFLQQQYNLENKVFLKMSLKCFELLKFCINFEMQF